mmetsp:Transcript_16037/g.62609  ORF Transcript_16037/g.62609 Transcript_16037/m.62609 type:complete len:338 (-) Transcript_16037:95-1108(-)
MPRFSKSAYLRFTLCFFAFIYEAHAHSFARCVKVTGNTVDVLFAHYHSSSGYFGALLVDGVRQPFTRLVPPLSNKLPNEAGIGPEDCNFCTTSNVYAWQGATVTLSPGSHTVSVTCDTSVECPYPNSCFSSLVSEAIEICGGDNPPTWTQNCPSNMFVTNLDSNGEATLSWTPPTAEDSCNSPLGVNHIGGPANGSTLDPEDGPFTVTYQTDPDRNGEQISCSFDITFGYARITGINQALTSLPPDTLAMYIPFAAGVEFVNIAQQSHDARLWLDDGSRTVNLAPYQSGSQTFNTMASNTDFTGVHGVVLGTVEVYATVDGDPYHFSHRDITVVTGN